MNMVSLWLLAYMEAALHSVAYLKFTLLLVLGTQACQIAAGQRHSPTTVARPSAARGLD